MTYAMREEIFSKEYLSIEDVQELLGMSYRRRRDCNTVKK